MWSVGSWGVDDSSPNMKVFPSRPEIEFTGCERVRRDQFDAGPHLEGKNEK
jgi:hypothetical protein